MNISGFYLILVLILFSGTCFSQEMENEKYEDEVLHIDPVRPMPIFNGGLDSLTIFFQERIKESWIRDLKFLVHVSITIDSSGNIIKKSINRSTDSTVNSEILGFIDGMPRWMPACCKEGKTLTKQVFFPIRNK